MKQKYNLKAHYFILLALILILNFIGILILMSASNNDALIVSRQIIGSLIGFSGCLVLSLINYDYWIRFSNVIYAIVIGLLLAVLLWGATHHGAGRWIVLPVMGQIQPAEFAKTGMIIVLGAFFLKHKDSINEPGTVFLSFILIGIPLFLIFIEPNLSTTIIVFVIFAVMLFCSGIDLKYILIGLIVIGVFAALFIFLFSTDNYKYIPFIHDYQKERILGFLNPEEYSDTFFQQSNSIMAIGSGGFFGKGLFNTDISSVKAGNFLIEEETDFIFAIIGEELGFRGCIGLFILYLFILLTILLIAGQAKDLAGKTICVGTAAWIGFQTFTNVAVATAIFPNTGVTLPFVSRGVSSLLALYLAIGVVLNISLQTKDY